MALLVKRKLSWLFLFGFPSPVFLDSRHRLYDVFLFVCCFCVFQSLRLLAVRLVAIIVPRVQLALAGPSDFQARGN